MARQRRSQPASHAVALLAAYGEDSKISKKPANTFSLFINDLAGGGVYHSWW